MHSPIDPQSAITACRRWIAFCVATVAIATACLIGTSRLDAIVSPDEVWLLTILRVVWLVAIPAQSALAVLFWRRAQRLQRDVRPVTP